jgi:16S rRNA (uracil1498-N3)-methyltransferase
MIGPQYGRPVSCLSIAARAGAAVIRAPVPGLQAGDARLGGGLAHYLVRVLRLRAGEEFTAFDPATGGEAEAAILRIEPDVIHVRVGEVREGLRPSAREVTFIQGYAKGAKCDAVVRDATELGVTRVVVAITRRSVVRLDPSRAAERQARWARIAEQAARQCGRSDAPRVEVPCPWPDALAYAPEGAAQFCLWERATEPLGPPLFDALSCDAPLVFACGPEGGLEDEEVELARARGFRIVSLGRFALRTETVASAVLGAVRVWGGDVRPPSPETV